MGAPVRFGRFWLHERIGRGGMADVYRATVGEEPYRFSLEFALKRMHDALLDDPMFVEMFLAEAYVQDLLHHPNIIRMYESGRLDQRVPYIAMEFIRGRDLAHVMERVRARHIHMPVDVALTIALETAKAIDFAHQARSATQVPLNIVHRDISPDNIYLTFNGSVKLGDFGVARVNNFEANEVEGMVKGKAAYTSPESLLGAEPTQRDDLWSLGVCLYEMVAARPFFDGDSDETIMRRVGTGRLPKLQLGIHTDRQLEALLRTLLNPKPHRRPQTAAEFYKAIRASAKQQSMQLEKENVGRFLLSVCGDVHVLATTQE
ncbi:MAG: serine/threonine-protein kinase, partial [Myxococcota bacterium]